MGDPIVAANRVFAGVGDTGFSFSQVLKAEGGKKSGLVRGLSWSAVYAFDAKTGRQIWRYPTHGEDMPSQCYDRATVFFGNGDGHVYALDAADGKPRWITATGGFDSMSSCTIYHGMVIAGFTDPNNLVAVDERSGRVVWRTTFPHVANTGMGDNSPTIDPQHDQVIQVAASEAQTSSPRATVNTTVLGIAASDGRIKWRTHLGRGPTPPAYKAGVAMVHDGVVYVSSPVTSKIYAIDGATGHIRWASAIPHIYAPGLGRGASAFLDGRLYQTTGSYIYVWDASSGRLLHAKAIGGRFGITNPVIVGRTLFAANSWGWIIAVPLDSIR